VGSKRSPSIQDRLQTLANQVGGPSALAALLGIHRGTLYDYLAGVRVPPTPRLEKIAAMFPCDPRWLLTGDGEPPVPSAARTHEAKAAAKGVKSGLGFGIVTDPGIFGLGPRPGVAMPLSMVRLGRQVKLESARERVLELVKMKGEDSIKQVLGSALYEEVKAGRACPSVELLFALAEALDVKARWVLGLEE